MIEFMEMWHIRWHPDVPPAQAANDADVAQRDLRSGNGHGLFNLFPRNNLETADPTFRVVGQVDNRVRPGRPAVYRWMPGAGVVSLLDLPHAMQPAPTILPMPSGLEAHENRAVGALFNDTFDRYWAELVDRVRQSAAAPHQIHVY